MTKVTVTLQYESVEDAIVGLGNILAGDGPDTSQKPKVDVGVVASEANKNVSARGPTKAVQDLLTKHGLKVEDVPGSGKDGRVTKKDVEDYLAKQAEREQPDDGEVNPGEPETTAPESAGEQPSLDDVRAALKKLNDSEGMNACRDVMARFGVNRVSELDGGQYAEFVAKCGAVVDGGEI